MEKVRLNKAEENRPFYVEINPRFKGYKTQWVKGEQNPKRKKLWAIYSYPNREIRVEMSSWSNVWYVD